MATRANSPGDGDHRGITGKTSQVIRFDIVDDKFKKEFIECINKGGTLRVIMDERILPNGEFGKYSQLID